MNRSIQDSQVHDYNIEASLESARKTIAIKNFDLFPADSPYFKDALELEMQPASTGKMIAPLGEQMEEELHGSSEAV